MKAAAVAELETALYEAAQRRHPELAGRGVGYIPKPKRNDSTANGLTRCIIDYIRLNGGQAERISITGRAQAVKNTAGRVVGIKYTQSHMVVGTADISATIQGRSVKIEVKVGNDRQSEAQREYQKSIEAAGGLYYVAHDFTTFVEWYKRTFTVENQPITN